MEHRAGATASFTFAGRVGHLVHGRWSEPGQGQGPDHGVAKGTFDQYAARPAFRVVRIFDGLGPGEHSITIRVLGRARGRATDAQVVVDAFRAGGKLVSNPDLDATWGIVERGSASGGSLGSSDLARSSAEVTFRGTGIDWYTARGPDQGRAKIYVDGLLVRTVDNYAASPAFDVARSITGLADGVHTLRIVVLATARARGDGRARLGRPLLDRPLARVRHGPRRER